MKKAEKDARAPWTRFGQRRTPYSRDAAPEMRRDIAINVHMTQGQYADLQIIAEAWDVGVAMVGYAILADFISELRGEALRLGPPDTRKTKAALAGLRLLAGVERENV